MNATFDGAEHKLLNHALNCLSRIGETLSMVCICEGERDYVVRMERQNHTSSDTETYHMDVTNDHRRIEVQLPISTMQSVLRNQLNRRLSSCELQLMEIDAECRLALRLHSTEGTTKTHKLTYEVAPSRFPRASPSMNEIIASPLTIQSLLDFFPNRPNGEIVMSFTPDVCSLRSKVDEGPEAAAKPNSLQTEARLHRESFVKYDVKENVVLVIGMKEFRAPVSMADHLQLPLEIRFDKAGDPMVLSLRMKEMYAQVFVATSNPDEDQQQEDLAQTAPEDSGPSVASEVGSANAAQSVHPRSTVQDDTAGAAADEHRRPHTSETSAVPASTVMPLGGSIIQEATQSMAYDGGVALPGQAAYRVGRMALPGQPFESTPLPTRREVQNSHDVAVASADAAAQEGGLFRGLNSDEPTSQDEVMSHVSKRPPRSAQSNATAEHVPAPPRAAPTVIDDGDSLFDGTTFEEDSEAQRLAGGDDEDGSGSDTQNSEDEIPSTQTGTNAKRRRFNRLF